MKRPLEPFIRIMEPSIQLPRSFKSWGRILKSDNFVMFFWAVRDNYVTRSSSNADVCDGPRGSSQRCEFPWEETFLHSSAAFGRVLLRVPTIFSTCFYIISTPAMRPPPLLSGISRVACSYLTSGVEWVICYLDRSVKQRRCAR